ncbi:TonB-dependent siderophore receptor [Methylobacterium sp. NEAU 140]|uniref:TonB-dependent siderophore receptor n=1 Tax=Methylobacterium sp. NEAU 140 TaxID=3064945 RepID=UPI0027327479|nr:TonB-dependent siderophore receptor [Methylobacterium sp. NEAU 140]MDP4021892.1 TonB-dependent siderophore receptor [Methylobacterium sp. NEAU 140]
MSTSYAVAAQALALLLGGALLAGPARGQEAVERAVDEAVGRGSERAAGRPGRVPGASAGPTASGSSRPTRRARPAEARRAARPRPATLVTRRELNERAVQTLEQAVAYTPESSVDTNPYDPRGDGIDIRGFDTTYNAIYRDGLLVSAANLAVPRIEPYGLDNVAVLRGPAAGVYGFNSPAGILNVTTKRPQFEPFGEVQLQAGNFGRYQGNFDVGGPVAGSDGTVAYRLTGVLREAGTFIPGGRDDRVYIAPAVTWKPDADTTLTVLGEYLSARLPSNPSYFYYRGYDVSRIYQGDPGFGTFRQDQYRIGYALEHRFAPDLIARQNVRYLALNNDFAALYTFYSDDEGVRRGTPRVERYGAQYRNNFASFTVDNQVEGRIETGPVGHTVTVGADYTHFDFKSRIGSLDTARRAPLDLRAPVYGLPVARPALVERGLQSYDQAGVYLQEQAKWDRFVLTLGGKYTWLSSRTTPVRDNRAGEPSIVEPATEQTKASFTYRVGLNYLLTPDIVPFVSYATTFAPQPGFIALVPVPPVKGDQLDGGVKFAIPEANITGSVSGFNINQDLRIERNLSQVFFQFAPGNAVARGVEAEMTAAVAPGTSLTLAYRHLDLRYTDQDIVLPDPRSGGLRTVRSPVDGNVVAGVPGETVTAFGTYLFPTSSPLSGLTVGGGLRFFAASFADDRNLVRNPTVTLFDAVVAYDLAALDPRYKGLRAQVNGFNVFNRDYTICQTVFCYRGAPATVIGSLVYRW